jgi:hypothetical protein
MSSDGFWMPIFTPSKAPQQWAKEGYLAQITFLKTLTYWIVGILIFGSSIQSNANNRTHLEKRSHFEMLDVIIPKIIWRAA